MHPPGEAIIARVFRVLYLLFFFFNDTATTEIYTLSLHDALPIYRAPWCKGYGCRRQPACSIDRKSTRLNSSHVEISYAVFCLKKKKKKSKFILHQKKKKKKKEDRKKIK